MKTKSIFLIIFIFIFYIGCKKDKFIDYYAILSEKERLLVGNWKLLNGIKIIENDFENSISYSDTFIYKNDSLYKFYHNSNNNDTTIYTEMFIFNEDKTYKHENVYGTIYYNPDSNNICWGNETFISIGKWLIIGDSSSLDFENTFKLVLNPEFTYSFTPSDTFYYYNIFKKRITELNENNMIINDIYERTGYTKDFYNNTVIYFENTIEEIKYQKQ